MASRWRLDRVLQRCAGPMWPSPTTNTGGAWLGLCPLRLLARAPDFLCQPCETPERIGIGCRAHRKDQTVGACHLIPGNEVVRRPPRKHGTSAVAGSDLPWQRRRGVAHDLSPALQGRSSTVPSRWHTSRPAEIPRLGASEQNRRSGGLDWLWVEPQRRKLVDVPACAGSSSVHSLCMIVNDSTVWAQRRGKSPPSAADLSGLPSCARP